MSGRAGHRGAPAGWVLLALVVLLGAWRPLPRSPLVLVASVGVLVTVVALRPPARWVVAGVAGAALLASWAGARAWAAVAPTAPGPLAATLVVRTDPVARGGIVVFDAEERAGDRRRLSAVVSGPMRAMANELQAGDEVDVSGPVSPRPDGADREARRHLVGSVAVRNLGTVRFASGVAGAANRLRRLVGIGAAPLDPEARALLGGFVFGDDRGQTPEQADAFRAAGLGHLLVVSGQNVAFVLLLARPLLRRCGRVGALVATTVILWGFAVMTRFEPSVLRATAMAVIAIAGGTLGRSVGGVRSLALAVVVLVALDPLIAGSVAFVLSVAASGGILVGARWVGARLRGPRPVREAIGVTVAAQVAVTPVLAAIGSGSSLAAIPANLLAAPVAGPLMAWGLVAGPVAGLAAEHGHPTVAAVLHRPTALGLGWTQAVARFAAALPLPVLPASVVVFAAIGAIAAGRIERRSMRRAVTALTCVPLLVIGLRPDHPPDAGCIGDGTVGTWCTVDAEGEPVQVVLLSGRSDRSAVLRAARDVPLRRVVAVVSSSAAGAQVALDTLAARVELLGVVAPPGIRVPAGVDEQRPAVETVVPVGGVRVRVVPVHDSAGARIRVDVEVDRRPP